jgi:hypothetical protein
VTSDLKVIALKYEKTDRITISGIIVISLAADGSVTNRQEYNEVSALITCDRYGDCIRFIQNRLIILSSNKIISYQVGQAHTSRDLAVSIH